MQKYSEVHTQKEYIAPVDQRAALLPWLPRGLESYFEYGLRAEELFKELQASKIPREQWQEHYFSGGKISAKKRAEQLPFVVQNLVKNQIANLDSEAAHALLDRYLVTEHKNSTQSFYASQNEQARVANAFICDLTDQEISNLAQRELKRQTSLALKTDRINLRKTDNDWRKKVCSLKVEDIMQIDLSEIEYNLKESRIVDVPTELQLKKKIRKIKLRTNDEYAHIAKLIGRDASHQKTGSWNIKEREKQRERWSDFAANSTVYDPSSGESVRLSAVVEAAKKKRLSETYTLSKGLQICAERLELQWCFAVLTAPPHFHPNPTTGKNSWDGSLACDSHKFILNLFRKACDELRLVHNIKLCGFRSPEAHQDSTAHQNVFFYCHKDEMQTVQKVLRKFWDWHEKAIDFKDQTQLKRIDKKPAKFASYCMKYAMKALAHDAVTADDAWYSTYSIRRIQFFGIPALTTWRTLRSLKESPDLKSHLVTEIWRAARRGDAATFIELNGGLCVSKKERPLHVKVERENNTKTTTIFFREKLIFCSSRECWRIDTKRSHANVYQGFGVILKLPKETQNPQNPPPPHPQN